MDLPVQPLSAGWRTYEWPLPRGAVAAGIHEAVFVAGEKAGRTPGSIHVGEVRLIRGGFVH